ncbi:MAG: cell division protein FtsQ/DivIB [Bacteroidetes bacterium]|nr:cell division protein FtsQ/DivIB [Bacteroidota bacterium]MCL5026851.1 cell division protein FtsQ/DivIB [Chloroflexota bacterium]
MSSRPNNGRRRGGRKTRAQPRRNGQSWLVSLGQRIGAFAGLGLLLFLLYTLVQSSAFTVNKVIVQGNRLVDAEAVAGVANVYGLNVFRINSEDIRRRVASLPQVESVQVLPRLPDVVVVKVHERQAAYSWRSGDRSYLLSADGVVLGEGEDAEGTTVILDKDEGTLHTGDRLGREVLGAAKRLTKWLPEKTGLSVENFEYSPTEGLSLVSENGYRIIFGSGENLGAKVAALQSILDQLAAEGRSVHSIDLRVDGRPYVR